MIHVYIYHKFIIKNYLSSHKLVQEKKPLKIPSGPKIIIQGSAEHRLSLG